jgi:hypothetical protein
MVLEELNEPLADHSGRAQNANFVPHDCAFSERDSGGRWVKQSPAGAFA